MNAFDMIRAMFIGATVAVPVAVLLALLWVSLLRRETISWRDMWRALTGRGR